MKFRLLGIDDCARMPVLGSMFIAGILIPLDKVDLLKKIKVKDSKLCTKKQITEKAPQLMKNFEFKVIEVTANQISNYNMNDLEGKAFYDIWDYFANKYYWELNKENEIKLIVYADNFDHSREAFLNRLKKLNLCVDDDKWVISHDCDKNHMACSAASIIAKYYHNQHIEQLHQIYGDIGNLNPGNLKTMAFLKAHLDELPDIVRSKYITVKKLYQEELL